MAEAFWPNIDLEQPELCRKCPTITGFKIGLVDERGRPTVASPLCEVHYATLIIFLGNRRCPGCRLFAQTLATAIGRESEPGTATWFRQEAMYPSLHTPGCNAVDVFLGRTGL